MSIAARGIAWEITIPLPEDIPSRDAASTTRMVEMAGPSQPPAVDEAPAPLAGHRFLVVEDEMLVALALSAGLQDARAEVLASTGSASEALAIIESQPLDGVLLDANLKGRPVDDIAAALTRRKVPFVFVTGYGRESLPRAFATAPLLAKPFSQAQLLEAATQLVEPGGKVVRLREK